MNISYKVCSDDVIMHHVVTSLCDVLQVFNACFEFNQIEHESSRIMMEVGEQWKQQNRQYDVITYISQI